MAHRVGVRMRIVRKQVSSCAVCISRARALSQVSEMELSGPVVAEPVLFQAPGTIAIRGLARKDGPRFDASARSETRAVQAALEGRFEPRPVVRHSAGRMDVLRRLFVDHDFH